MKKLLLSMLFVSNIVVAQNSKAYLDMSPIWLNYESNGISSKFNPTAFKWTAGYVVKDFSFVSLAVEGSAMLGVNSDSKSTVTNSSGVTFSNAEVSVDKIYALHLKSMFPITKELNANLYLGGARSKLLLTSDSGIDNNHFENSFSAGAGLEYWLPSDVSLYANYMQYFKNLNSIEVGLGFRF